MRTLLIIPLIAILLTACVPRIGDSPSASLDVQRDGVSVTATLEVAEDATQVAVVFRGGVSREFVEPTLTAGVYSFSVVSVEPVSCSASGFIRGRYFLIFC